MAKIDKIHAREILDSRGNPTVEVKVYLSDGTAAKASVPSGASTGIHEAWELRDGDKQRYEGQGVLQAVKNVNEQISQKIVGMDAEDQEAIDRAMIALDGTENKSKLGANAILGVSLACARAAATSKKQELYDYLAGTFDFSKDFRLPTPSFNIFNGGKHADTNLDFQEFMILPLSTISFKEKVRMGSEIFHSLGRVLKSAGFDTDVGNEGGYAPDIVSSIQAIELIVASMIKAGYKPGKEVGLGIDVGSSQLFNPETGKYIFKLDQATFSNSTLVGLYHEWWRKFPIISIEDGLAEDDWAGWRDLTKELGSEMLLIGDDLFVTNTARLRKGIKEKVANAILIKVNQVGTLTETMECIKLAQKHKYKIMVSHRSGETSDDFIADLAVAVGAEYIKSGSLSRSERLAKYNRLMEIEDMIESQTTIKTKHAKNKNK
ncbi:phosphopyruvate hydratase [Candidatus Falkowbacteria bacterium]|nr:phosphopyruvate hydratase [Candidatus Falkowbacteria bacterium]